MKKNVGDEDGYIRLLLGATFLVQIIVLEPGIVGGIIFSILGVGFLLTSYACFCPAYLLFKINTTGQGEVADSAKEESTV